ncbi:MAG: secondary thiamine-phosphate synthase enzyme [Candidatus Thorarchaeota archaeon]|nr:MAG: secondary thiamine-phosphate synthase enzyme [Candidatus Thorarchaeota archaeon]
MSFYHEILEFHTQGDCDMIDITKGVEDVVKRSGMTSGICTVFCAGSTGSITTIEYESGLLSDFPEAMERIAPSNAEYKHDLRWRDGNGYSHVRASIVGPSLTVPFVNRQLTLGTWQQVVFVDYDNRPRNRTVEVVIIGG